MIKNCLRIYIKISWTRKCFSRTTLMVSIVHTGGSGEGALGKFFFHSYVVFRENDQNNALAALPLELVAPPLGESWIRHYFFPVRISNQNIVCNS